MELRESSNIASALALIITLAYVAVIVTCTYLKTDIKYFNEFSMVEMAIISYYFGSSHSPKVGGERDEPKADGKV